MIENYADKIKRYFRFSKNEYRDFFSIVVIFSFVLAFTSWGALQFSAVEGFKNWFMAALIVAIGLFVHHAAQRLIAILWGFSATQKIWMPGLLVGLFFVFLSNGEVMIFAATSTLIHVLPLHRLGKARKGPDLKTLGTVCLFGPLANILFAASVYVMYSMAPSDFLMQLTSFNLAFGLWNLLPIPPLDGGKMFFGSRLVYAWFAGAVLSFVGFFWALNFSIIVSTILSIMAGTVLWLFVWIVFESS